MGFHTHFWTKLPIPMTTFNDLYHIVQSGLIIINYSLFAGHFSFFVVIMKQWSSLHIVIFVHISCYFFFFNKKKNFIWSVHKNFNIVNLNSNIDTQTIKNIKEYHHTSFWQNKMVQVLVTKHCIVTFFLSND